MGAAPEVVKVSVPVELTAGCAAKAALLSLLTRNETVCDDSLAGPALIAVAQFGYDCGPLPLEALSSGPFVKLGASLTPVTVIVNVCAPLASTPPFAVPPLSCATTFRIHPRPR